MKHHPGKKHASFPLKDAKPGQYVVTTQSMDGGEWREVLYVKDEERTCRYDYNVSVGRLGVIQGDLPPDENTRYVRLLPEPCRDPGEADGRTPVIDVEWSMFATRWGEHIKAVAKTDV